MAKLGVRAYQICCPQGNILRHITPGTLTIPRRRLEIIFATRIVSIPKRPSAICWAQRERALHCAPEYMLLAGKKSFLVTMWELALRRGFSVGMMREMPVTQIQRKGVQTASAGFSIGNRKIGPGEPVYIIAELSANHNQSFEQAVNIIHAAKEAGAEAVKLQTYTADTITIRSSRECFHIKGGTLWDGRILHDLYAEAHTPWEWQPELKRIANGLGLDLFSSPFDGTAVDFLEQMNVPAYKVASPELVDIPLIEKIARTGKPIILSTGMATIEEISEAVEAASRSGAANIALLKCTSSYPASAQEMNLRAIPELVQRFQCPVGLSDHTMDIAVPVASVALGACIIEKHLTLSRAHKGPDSDFSLEPQEFREMVKAVRTAEQALGQVHFGTTEKENSSRAFRRSLFVVKDVLRGEPFTEENVRSIRPADGLHTRHLPEILGGVAACDIAGGTPFRWDFLADSAVRKAK